jgi:hypothetical protein
MSQNTQQPDYRVTGDPELDENPLIAHLNPVPEDEQEAYGRLQLRLQIDVAEREKPNSLRRRRIRALGRFFVPADPVHSRALIEIGTNVIDSYIHRNPLSPNGQMILHGRKPPMNFRPAISLITGHSGMGKSTLMDRILEALGRQVTRHAAFAEQPFPESQILWLRRNVPPRCTVSRLCQTFGRYTDQVLEYPVYDTAFMKLRPRAGGEDVYLAEISKIIRAHHVGALVLDEFQNLSLLGSGAKHVIALLVNLRDELGVPIVLVGTNKSLELLEGDFSPARRLAEGGYFELIRPTSAEDPVWENTCMRAWQYQWVKNPIDFSDKVREKLYDVSQGITGVMLTAFQHAQLMAIENGSESVTEDLIQAAFDERMTPLHQAIRAMRSGDPLLMAQWDDLTRNFWPKERQDADPATSSTPSQVAPKDNAAPPVLKISAKKTTSSPKRSKSQVATLTPEQLRAQVIDANSMADMIRVLEG